MFYCDMHGNGTMVGWNDKESPFRIIAKEKLKCELSQTCFNCAAMIGFTQKLEATEYYLIHLQMKYWIADRGESAGEIEIIALWAVVSIEFLWLFEWKEGSSRRS